MHFLETKKVPVSAYVFYHFRLLHITLELTILPWSYSIWYWTKNNRDNRSVFLSFSVVTRVRLNSDYWSCLLNILKGHFSFCNKSVGWCTPFYICLSSSWLFPAATYLKATNPALLCSSWMISVWEKFLNLIYCFQFTPCLVICPLGPSLYLHHPCAASP